MTSFELLEIIKKGETSRVQFKEKLPHTDSFSAELVAMSNARGGIILIGVKDKKGDIIGLNYEELQQTGNKIAAIATDCVNPMIYIQTEVVEVESKNVLIVFVEEGTNKPYKDNQAVVWMKQGSDKRKVTDNNELLRFFQTAGSLYFDELPVLGTGIKDLFLRDVEDFFQKEFKREINDFGLSYEQVLQNMNILKGKNLTLAGLLFFGRNPQQYKPAFGIKAVSFLGNEITGTEYRDSRDITGTIPDLFRQGMSFFKNNLKHLQKEQNFNSTGILELSEIALEELLQNALVHRDYTKNAPVRLLIFDNRIEIISPGKLPNSLTVNNIKFGNAVVRNNLIATFCAKTMPYRGLGSGVLRALQEQPDTELINDEDGEQFIVKIPRESN